MVNDTVTLDGQTVYGIAKNDTYADLKPGNKYQIDTFMKYHVKLVNNKRRYRLSAFELELADGTKILKSTKQPAKENY